MKDNLTTMHEACLAAIADTRSETELEAVRLKFLGKKGELTSILKLLGKLPPEERKEVGMLANQLKQEINEALAARKQTLIEERSVVDSSFDLSLPGIKPKSGSLHPITQMCYDL